MSKQHGYTETDEFLSFAHRIARALMRRAADGNPEDLEAIITFVGDLNGMLGDAVERYVASDAHLAPQQRTRTWTQVGRLLGISRQAAEQKYSKAGRARAREAQARYVAKRAA